MDKKLIQLHIEEKNKRNFTNKKFDNFFDGKVLQVCFYSKGCKYSKKGSCIMCDYGKPRKENLKPNDIKEIIKKSFIDLKEKPKVLLLNSLGSILDETEMPRENLIVLLDEISKININIIVFETHYTNINDDILELIKQKLPKKEIDIELGLESSNPEYRKEYLNKVIDNNQFIKKIQTIKSYGFNVETNIIYGMPFINTSEQIKDTIQSVIWCFENNIDLVNLFPINIKPYTLLYKLYENNKYLSVKHKDFIFVLQQLPTKYLDKIYLSWYGNRRLYYDGKQTILPKCEKNDYEKIMNFYRDFNLNNDKIYRKYLLNNLKL